MLERSDYVLYIIETESEGLMDYAQNIGVILSFQAALFVTLLQKSTSPSILKTFGFHRNAETISGISP